MLNSSQKIGLGGIAYLVATTLGFLYAHSYYGVFGIEFLNFADPLDLIFLFFNSLHDMLALLGLELVLIPTIAVAIALILLAAILVALAVLALVRLLNALIKTGVLQHVLHCLVLPMILFAIAVITPVSVAFLFAQSAILFSCATIAAWLSRIYLVLRSCKSIKRHALQEAYATAKERYPSVSSERYLERCKYPLNLLKHFWLLLPDAAFRLQKAWKSFLEWRKETYQKLRQSVPSELGKYLVKLKKLMKVILAVSAVLVAAIAIFVAIRSGHTDAKCIIQYEQGCDVRLHPIDYIWKVGFYDNEDKPGWLKYPFKKVLQKLDSDGNEDKLRWLKYLSGKALQMLDGCGGKGVEEGCKVRSGGTGSGESGNGFNQLRRTFVVPTANVASMEFLPNCHCLDGTDKADGQIATQTSSDGESKDGGTDHSGKQKEQDCNCLRKYVRATVRQDAGMEGPTNLPACLVYIGATETAQFLVEIMDDKASALCRQLEPRNDKQSKDSSPGPGDCSPRADCEECSPAANCAPCKGDSYFWGNIERGACKSEFTALVGPFTTGSRDQFEQTNGTEGSQSSLECGADRSKQLPITFDKLVERIKVRLKQRGNPSEILLIGRTDSQPINNDEFRSNSGLAQARANWVWERLKSEYQWPDDLYVVRTSAGPFVPGKFYASCDRSVEVHIRW